MREKKHSPGRAQGAPTARVHACKTGRTATAYLRSAWATGWPPTIWAPGRGCPGRGSAISYQATVNIRGTQAAVLALLPRKIIPTGWKERDRQKSSAQKFSSCEYCQLEAPKRWAVGPALRHGSACRRIGRGHRGGGGPGSRGYEEERHAGARPCLVAAAAPGTQPPDSTCLHSQNTCLPPASGAREPRGGGAFQSRKELFWATN